MKLRELFNRQDRNTNDHGFNMLELIMVVVVIGILGGIGFAIYSGVSSTARDTVLSSNIATAATELIAAMDLEPAIASSSQSGRTELKAVMADRTEFAWEDEWEFDGDESDDKPNLVRFQWLEDAAAAVPAVPSGTPAAPNPPPGVEWLRDGDSAIRVHIRNNKNQWACALIVLKTDHATIKTKMGAQTGIGATGADATDPEAKLKAAELRGVWYDSGTGAHRTGDTAGVHDCSPVADSATSNPANQCLLTGTGTAGERDTCLPVDANTWDLTMVAAANVDGTSATDTIRTLRSQP